MLISISYVCVLYNTIKLPYQPKHSPSSKVHRIESQGFLTLRFFSKLRFTTFSRLLVVHEGIVQTSEQNRFVSRHLLVIDGRSDGNGASILRKDIHV